MKKLLLLFVLFSVTAMAQVDIGDGTEVGNHIPVEPFFGYTYSQVIYTQEEIGASMEIGMITYYATPETTLEDSHQWTVYMGHTTKTQFDSNDDWIPVSEMTEVFSGDVTIENGTVHILLNGSFNYNGTDNLVIAVDENQQGYDSYNHDFYTSAVDENRSIYYYSDSTNPDPASPVQGTVQAFIANITLSPPPTCPWPTDLAASNITTDSAELSWTENGSATEWNIEYGTTGFTPGTGTQLNVTENPYTLTGLESYASYDFYVQSVCGAGDESLWSGPFSFQTALGDGTCGVFTIEMIDSFGDGWNGGYLDIYINGTLLYPGVTLDSGAGPENFQFPVDTGDIISIVYTAGSWSSENLYNVYDQDGNLIASDGTDGTPEGIGDPAVPNGLEACPSCPAPVNLTASNVTSSSADLSWTETGSATEWLVEYGFSGFTLGTGTQITTTDNPLTITGLISNQAYDAYVKSLCSAGDESQWSFVPVTFTTLPEPPVNDNCSNAIEIPLDGTFINTTNFYSSPSGEEPLPEGCGELGPANDVWYTLTATEYSNITISTQGVSGGLDDTILAVYSGSCGDLELLGCNDDYLSGFSQVTVNAIQEGETLYVRVFSAYYGSNTVYSSFQIGASFVPAIGYDDEIYNSIYLYPNPAEEILNIETPVSASYITITDTSGKTVYHTEEKAPGIIRVPVSRLERGMYLLHIGVNGFDYVKKFVR